MPWKETEDAGGQQNPTADYMVSAGEVKTLIKQLVGETTFYQIEPVEVLDSQGGVITGRYCISEHNENTEGCRFIPLSSNVIQYPIVGEMVLGFEYNNERYYFSDVNPEWSKINSPQYNASNTDKDGVNVGQQSFVDIKPKRLLVGEGDTIIQGRFGNSIRLGSNQGENRFDSPNIKLVAGVRDLEPEVTDEMMFEDEGGFDVFSDDYMEAGADLDFTIETLPKDKSSIYLTTDEQVNYPQPSFLGANEITKGIFNFNRPMDLDYTEPQIIFDSDRILLNAKQDDIGIFAAGNIHIKGNRVQIANDNGGINIKGKEIVNDVSEANAKIINATKEGIPFPELNMAGFLKQTMGIQALFKALSLGIPKLSNPLTLKSGVRDIVKGLKGAKNFIDATTNLEFLEKDILTTKTPEEIKAALPIPESLLGIVGDIQTFSKNTKESIEKAKNFVKDNKVKIEKAKRISAAIDTGDRRSILNVLQGMSQDELDGIPGANDALTIARDRSVGGGDIDRARAAGVFSNLENYIGDFGSQEQDVDTLKSYEKILKNLQMDEE
tara:strand:+ start:220 stop:1875 length:1656 start_codon:yes stop_codon:yes gene_type:complete